MDGELDDGEDELGLDELLLTDDELTELDELSELLLGDELLCEDEGGLPELMLLELTLEPLTEDDDRLLELLCEDEDEEPELGIVPLGVRGWLGLILSLLDSAVVGIRGGWPHFPSFRAAIQRRQRVG